MPNPTPGSVYVNKLLTDQSIAYVQSDDNFAALKAAPPTPAVLQSGLVAKYSKEDFLQVNMAPRAAGERSREGGYRTDNTLTYNCGDFALSRPVTDQERANSQDPYQPDRDTTVYL